MKKETERIDHAVCMPVAAIPLGILNRVMNPLQEPFHGIVYIALIDKGEEHVSWDHTGGTGVREYVIVRVSAYFFRNGLHLRL